MSPTFIANSWFLNPFGLWALTAIPFIVLLYILKLRRQPQVISSILLWSKVLKEMQANTPFQKLRNNLLLWIQILLVILLALALARPILKGQLKLRKRVVAILDTSASMKTKDIDGKTRFEKAKEQLLEMIENLAEGDHLMILEGTRSEGKQTLFTAKKRELLRSLDEIKVRDTTTELSESLILAASSLKSQDKKEEESGEIYIFSDGANLHLDQVSNIHIPVRLIQVGNSGDNLGITALDVRRETGTKDRYQIFVTVKNFYTIPKEFYLSLKVGENEDILDVRKIELNSRESHSEIFNTFLNPGPLTIEIDEPDPFLSDNKVYYYVLEEKETPVLIVTDGQNTFIEKVLRVDPLADVQIVSPEQYDESLLDKKELVIFDRFMPPSLPLSNTIFLAPPVTPKEFYDTDEKRKELPFVIKQRIIGSEITEWDAVHPLMRYVEFGDVNLFEALEVEYPRGLKMLVQSAYGPLISLIPHKHLNLILIAFDVRASNWILRASFIIFFSNALQQAKKQFHQLAGDTHAGKSVLLQVTDPQASIQIVTPSKDKITVLNKGESTYFSKTDEIGFYSVHIGDQTSHFAVNLLNEQESDILPAEKIDLGTKKSLEIQKRVSKVNREVWWWCALAVLLFTFMEWLVFHRRIA
jgi:hypothetical protein